MFPRRRYFLSTLLLFLAFMAQEGFSKPNQRNISKIQFKSGSGYVLEDQSYGLSLEWEKSRISLRMKWGQLSCSSEFSIDTSEKHKIEESIQKLKFCRKKSKYSSIAQDAPSHTITLFYLSGKKSIYKRKKFLDGTSPYICGGTKKIYHTFHSILEKRKGKICGSYDILLQ